MAELNPPYFMQNGAHPADVFRRALESLLRASSSVPAGVITAGDLAVTVTTGLSVSVAAGDAFVPGTESSVVQGAYHVTNNAAVVKTLGAADATNPRYDLVIARVRDEVYSGALSMWAIEVVAGTPAASPLEPATPANSIVLARVLVGAGVTSLVAGNIVDRRPRVGPARTRASRTTNQIFTHATPAAVAWSSAVERVGNPSPMWTAANPTRLYAPVSGLYDVRFSATMTPGAATGYSAAYINRNGAQVSPAVYIPNNASVASPTVHDLVEMTAGEYLECFVLQTAGVNNTAFTATAALAHIGPS